MSIDLRRIAEAICENIEAAVHQFMTPTLHRYVRYFATIGGIRIGLGDIHCTNYDFGGWYCTGVVYARQPTSEGPVGTFAVSASIPPVGKPYVVVTVMTRAEGHTVDAESIQCAKAQQLPHKVPPPAHAPPGFGMPTAPGVYPPAVAPRRFPHSPGPSARQGREAWRIASEIISNVVYEAYYGKSGVCTKLISTPVDRWCRTANASGRFSTAISGVYECITLNPGFAARCYTPLKGLYGVEADPTSPVCWFANLVTIVAYLHSLTSEEGIGSPLQCDVELDDKGRPLRAVSGTAAVSLTASDLSECARHGLPKHLPPEHLFGKNAEAQKSSATIMCMATYIKAMFDAYRGQPVSAIRNSLTSLLHINDDPVLNSIASALCGVDKNDLANAVAAFLAELPNDETPRTCTAYAVAIGAMTWPTAQERFKPEVRKKRPPQTQQ